MVTKTASPQSPKWESTNLVKAIAVFPGLRLLVLSNSHVSRIERSMQHANGY